MSDYNMPTFVSYGWICPKCGRVNSPTMPTCPCYFNDNVIITNGHTTDIKHLPSGTITIDKLIKNRRGEDK